MTSTSLATAGTFPYMSLTQPVPTAFPPAITPLPQRPTYYPSILYWYPAPPVSAPMPQTPAISYYTPSPNTATGPYTGPCMIIMRGLPIHVTVQDIVNYFQGFPEVGFKITKSNLLRLFACWLLLRFRGCRLLARTLVKDTIISICSRKPF